MGDKEFIELCKNFIKNYVNDNLEKTDNTKISIDDVYLVWCCKTLENNKALLSTTLSDGMYYECTFNGNKEELYLDAYKKWENIAYKTNKGE